jgi:subfamily B ATP-binding cassette protein HlyB/CyaB
MDTALHALVALARFHRLPAEPDQLAHQFGSPGQPFSDTDVLLAAKALTLKAKRLKPALSELNNTMLPAIAKTRDGHYIILARLANDDVTGDTAAAQKKRSLAS